MGFKPNLARPDCSNRSPWKQAAGQGPETPSLSFLPHLPNGAAGGQVSSEGLLGSGPVMSREVRSRELQPVLGALGQMVCGAGRHGQLDSVPGTHVGFLMPLPHRNQSPLHPLLPSNYNPPARKLPLWIEVKALRLETGE